MGITGIESFELVGGNNCQFFAEQRDYEGKMYRKYNTLVFLISVAVAACVIGLIVSISIKEWGATAATSIGTVTTGAAVKFILDRRAEHRARSIGWAQRITANNCPQ